MSGERSRIDRIAARWETDRKISGADVAYLIVQARAADTMRDADALNRGSGRGSFQDLLNMMGGWP